MHDTAVFFLTHQWSEAIAFRFARLWREVSPRADCFVLLHDDEGVVAQNWRTFLESFGASAALRPFVPDALPGELGFPFFGDRRVLGNTHFPLMNAARRGAWRHCWQIESDVEYRGTWTDFLRLFDKTDADLLVSHIHKQEDWPTWQWWLSLRAPRKQAATNPVLLKGFFPVFRISRPAIDIVMQAHKQGWTGHFEVLVPTVLAARGLKVQDLRDAAQCYVGDSQNPCKILPVQSTMRWRPEIMVDEFVKRASGPLLFHPVKENWAFDANGVRRWDEPRK